jgi:DNA-binding XRE family transcriptional regulator
MVTGTPLGTYLQAKEFYEKIYFIDIQHWIGYVEQQVAPMFAHNIKKLRIKKKLTQQELSTMADIHTRYLQDLEAGRKSPTVRLARKIKDSLDCTWNQLLD